MKDNLKLNIQMQTLSEVVLFIIAMICQPMNECRNGRSTEYS